MKGGYFLKSRVSCLTTLTIGRRLEPRIGIDASINKLSFIVICFVCLKPVFSSFIPQVWQLGSAHANFTLEGHEKGLNCVDYFQGGDKPYLISGADDRYIITTVFFFY